MSNTKISDLPEITTPQDSDVIPIIDSGVTSKITRANLLTGVTSQGNTFNGASQLVKLDSSAHLPALNSSALTSLTSGNLTGALPAISGAALTGLNASNLSSGTVGTARLGTGTANGTSYLRGDGTWHNPHSLLTTDTDGSTVTFDVSDYNKHIVTIAGSRTLVVSNDVDGQGFTIIIIQGSGGSHTVTWWSGIHWQGGTPPTLSTSAGAYDVFSFIRISSGLYLGAGGGMAQVNFQGPIASLPSAGTLGRTYFCTDAPYVFFDTGSIWIPYLAPLCVEPGPASGWTWVNQGSSTIDGSKGVMSLVILNTTPTLNWRGLFQAPPSTPYTITALLRTVQWAVNSNTAGIYFYDGTKLMGLEVLCQATGTSNTIRVEKITDIHTDGSTLYSHNSLLFGPQVAPTWFRLRNDGTTLYFDYSLDGAIFYNITSEAVGTFITPTMVGFGGLCATSDSGLFVVSSLLSWTMTSP